MKHFFSYIGLGIMLIFNGILSDAGTIQLAADRFSIYAVVAPVLPSADEKAAIADLKATLSEITGADFQDCTGRQRSIFVGRKAPSDHHLLAENERRIRTENQDIYLYGEGRYGNTAAVYDFLKDILGCRWFTVSGDRKIPKQNPLVLPELNLNLIPSIPHMTIPGGSLLVLMPDFFRRNCIYDRTEGMIGTPDIHAGQRIIPSGLISFNRQVGSIKGPLKYFKEKAYFKTHPDFFSMDGNGKRVTSMQLCYSNPALRREFFRNIEIVIKHEYRGGRMIVGVGQDDNGGMFCYCPNCKTMAVQYGHPAGPYYDFLLELSAYFKQTYPDLLFSFLAYRIEQTLTPPEKLTTLPENLLPSYAPLDMDFSKPLTHPNNQTEAKLFEKWARISSRIHWWVYPTTYPRPVVSFPLTANINRVVENLRFARNHKVWMAYCEFGPGFFASVGFNDLRLYLIAELCRKMDSDPQRLIQEFAETCYGAAAESMLEYLAELEKLEAASPDHLRWNPDIRIIRYATPENLLRWERQFDAMEKSVGNDRRLLLNLRRVRYTLDQMLVAEWPRILPLKRSAFGDLEVIVNRLKDTVRRDYQTVFATISNPVRREKLWRERIDWTNSGIDQFIALARGGKPLPKKLDTAGSVRLLPNCNKLGLRPDAAAAFGLCNVFNVHSAPNWLTVLSYDKHRVPSWNVYPSPIPLALSRIRVAGADGQYRFYHLGAIKLEPNCVLNFAAVAPSSNFFLGHLFEPDHPDRLFDLWLSLAYDEATRMVKVDQLVVIPLDRTAESMIKPTAADVVPDEFQ